MASRAEARGGAVIATKGRLPHHRRRRTEHGLSRRHLTARPPDYPYGERGQSQRDRRVSGGRF